MKLSSRTKLLKEADDVLRQIRSSINEIDWEAHEYEAQRPYYWGTDDKLKYAMAKFLRRIELKYKDKNDPESKEKEIQELIDFTEKLKEHLKIRRQIPKDPKQQTEIEKLIVAAPKFPKGYDYVRNYTNTLVKDPETGMYWSKQTGLPQEPPEWFEEFRNANLEMLGVHVWDDTKGWVYNILMKLWPGGEG